MKSKKKSENTLRQKKKKNETTTLQKSLRYSKSSSKRGVHSDTSLPQEIRKLSNKPFHQWPKRIIQRRTNKTQMQKEEGNNKDGVKRSR